MYNQKIVFFPTIILDREMGDNTQEFTLFAFPSQEADMEC